MEGSVTPRPSLGGNIRSAFANTGFKQSMSHPVPETMTYLYPILKPQEIQRYFHDALPSCNIDGLAEPEKHKDSVRRCLEQLIEVCTGVNREELSQPVYAGLQALVFPELHEDSIQEINFFRTCQRMMAITLVNDFSIKDLTEPDSKRFRKQLSAAINFAKFKEERLALFHELNSQNQSLSNTLSQERAENERLKRLLAEKQEQTAAEARVIQETDLQIRNLESEVESFNYQLSSLTSQCEEVKRNCSDVKNEYTACCGREEEKQELKRCLQGQIVQSPERMKKELVACNQLLRQEKVEVSDLQVRVSQLTQSYEYISNLYSLIHQDIFASLEELEREVDKQKEAMGDVKGTREKIKLNKERIKEAGDAMVEISHQIRRSEERLTNIRQANGNRVRELNDNIAQMQLLLEEEGRKREADVAEGERLNGEIARMEQKLAILENTKKSEIERMMDEFNRMQEVVMADLLAVREEISNA